MFQSDLGCRVHPGQDCFLQNLAQFQQDLQLAPLLLVHLKFPQSYSLLYLSQWLNQAQHHLQCTEQGYPEVRRGHKGHSLLQSHMEWSNFGSQNYVLISRMLLLFSYIILIEFNVGRFRVLKVTLSCCCWGGGGGGVFWLLSCFFILLGWVM